MIGIKHLHSDTDVSYFRLPSYHNIIALLKVNILMWVQVTHYSINLGLECYPAEEGMAGQPSDVTNRYYSFIVI
jgi:hypothetical protein